MGNLIVGDVSSSWWRLCSRWFHGSNGKIDRLRISWFALLAASL
jgi:hypothetical protein